MLDLGLCLLLESEGGEISILEEVEEVEELSLAANPGDLAFRTVPKAAPSGEWWILRVFC